MEFGHFAALLIFLFRLAFSPGPGNLFFAANGACFGFRAAAMPMAGYHSATFGVTLAMGFGFSIALTATAQAFAMIKIVGSMYVLWLAWTLCRASRLEQPKARAAGFWSGAVLLLLNPKAYIIIALMFTQFLTETSGTPEVAAIAVVFTMNNLVAFALYTAVGDRLAKTLRTEAHERNLNAAIGAILAMVGIWILIS